MKCKSPREHGRLDVEWVNFVEKPQLQGGSHLQQRCIAIPSCRGRRMFGTLYPRQLWSLDHWRDWGVEHLRNWHRRGDDTSDRSATS